MSVRFGLEKDDQSTAISLFSTVMWNGELTEKPSNS